VCGKKAPEHLVDKGLQLVFGVCAGLAAFGFIVTYFFVDDTPHDSLTMFEEGSEAESEEEVNKQLEMVSSKV